MALKSSSDKHEKSSKRNKKHQRTIKSHYSNDFKQEKITNTALERYANKKKKPNRKLSTAQFSNVPHLIETEEGFPNNSYILSSDYMSVCTAEMATYCPQYMSQQTYCFPIIMTEWSPIVNTVQTPVYATPIQQVPFAVINSSVLPQLCPYTGAIVAEPIITTVLPQPIMPEPLIGIAEHSYNPITYSPEQIPPSSVNIMNDQAYYKIPYEDNIATQDPIAVSAIDDSSYTEDPVEFYLNLPRELFPTTRMLAIDPNPIVDEFCKQSNINDHAAWILDLEFGIPRVPITRAIPVYDVQFNSIHCKNTPSAIHPGFESCSENFKRVVLFYYDCIVSAWYRGYVILNNDRSVENFQYWLLLAMQFFGMCWP